MRPSSCLSQAKDRCLRIRPTASGWLYLATVNTLGEEAAKLSRIALSALQAQGFYIVESDQR